MSGRAGTYWVRLYQIGLNLWGIAVNMEPLVHLKLDAVLDAGHVSKDDSGGIR